MLTGATTILYEGKPIGSPDAGTFWRLISDYKVKTMFTAPTAVRAIAREDPKGLLAKKYDLSSLTSLFLAGERSDPETLKWCQNLVYENCTVIDNYWSTECKFFIYIFYFLLTHAVKINSGFTCHSYMRRR